MPRFTPGRVDFGPMAVEYTRGRALSPETAAAWRDAVARHLPRTEAPVILDLGCGAGRFSSLLAEWCSATVIGVEPAPGMLAQALEATDDPRVRYVLGRAEAIPLSETLVDLAWLSNVIHHVLDRPACARELHRVLKPVGRVLIAGAFAGRLDGITMFRYFPAARQVAEGFPAVEQVAADFAAAGLTLDAVERVTQQTCRGLAELAVRTGLRADTTLTLITDDEFAAGQLALERAAATEDPPRPVLDTVDLLAFSRLEH